MIIIDSITQIKRFVGRKVVLTLSLCFHCQLWAKYHVVDSLYHRIHAHMDKTVLKHTNTQVENINTQLLRGGNCWVEKIFLHTYN